VFVMRHAQADADAVIGEAVERVGRHDKNQRVKPCSFTL
jgi:hypothetical protein